MTAGNGVLHRTNVLLTLGRAQEAETLLRTALLHSPDDPQLHRQLARSLLQQKKHGDARDEAVRSLALEPDNVVTLLHLSAALMGLGDRPGALAPARRAVVIAPASPHAHAQLGVVLLNSSQLAESMRELRKARELDPTYIRPVTTLALAHLRLRQYAEARELVAAALTLDPNDAQAHRVSGLVEAAAGDTRRALVSSREAMRLNPVDAAGRAAYAQVLKSRNPLYRGLVRNMRGRNIESRRTKLLRLTGPLILLLLVMTIAPGETAEVEIAMIAVFFAIGSIEPITNAVVCLGGHRDLLQSAVRRSAAGYSAYLLVIITCAAWGLAAGRPEPWWCAAVAACWSIAAGHAYRALPTLGRWVGGAHVAGVLLVVAACWQAARGSSFFPAVAGAAALVGIACWLAEVLPWKAIAAA